MTIARRDFLKVGTAGLLGLSLPQILAAEARAAGSSRANAKAKSVILVWLPGGPSAIDMWDTKPNAPEGIRGDFRPIRTACPGIEFADTLPKTAAVANKLTVVRSLNHTIPSHVPAIKYMTTGNRPAASLTYPSLGSLAAKLLTTPRGVPPYVTFDERRNSAATAGYLGTGFNPFIIEGNGGTRERGGPAFRVRGITLPGGFSMDDLRQGDELRRAFDTAFGSLDARDSLVEGLDTFHQQALDILRSEKTRAAFNLEAEPARVRQMYGNSRAGMAALAARRLIEAGVRFATITTGGWDTHTKNFETLRIRNMPPLDTVLSALIADLDQRGLLDSTIVLCAGEFSRTPRINTNAGRDHWARCMSVVVAGGGFKRGYIHGSTDPLGMAPTTDPLTPEDLAATIFSLLGIDPHRELQTSTGRPVQLFRDGKYIGKLVA